jgi:hypothetical protein
MSVLDFPGKLVESAAHLTERKLQLAVDLLRIFYGPNTNKCPATLEELIHDYICLFENLRDLTPPEQTTTYMRHHKKIIKVLLLIGILVVFVAAYFYNKWGHLHILNTLIQLLS